MSNFATTITNHFRKTGTNYADKSKQQAVRGFVLQETTCTRFEWQWLLLPIALIVVSTAILVWMMAQVYLHPDKPIWKNSLLPFLFYGFRHPDEGPRHVAQIDVLERRAAKMSVVVATGRDTGFVNRTAREGGI